MTVRRSAFIWSMIFILIISASNIIIFNLNCDENSQLIILGYILLGELVVFLLINSKISGCILNFSMVFAVVLFIFNFGQVMINTFFKNIYSHVRFLLLLGAEDSLRGFKYINLAFSTLLVGLLVAQLRTSESQISKHDSYMNNYFDFEKIAKDIILFTFPVKMFIDIMTLVVSITTGGAAARIWLNNFPNVFLYYGKISLIGFALLIIGYRNFPLKQNIIFIFIEVYILIMMISGVRSENVGYLLIFAFIYFANRIKSISAIKVILYGFIGVIFLAFIITVGEFRNVNVKSMSGFIETFNSALTQKNVILSLFDTCGDTGYTAQCVISKWLPLYGPSGGDSYYLGWMSVVPNIPYILTFPGMITEKSCFALKMQAAKTLSENYLNIGGSLIGEQFFNFGLFGGCIATFIIGIFLGMVSRKCYIYFKNENFYGLIRVIPIMFAAIYWIRDYFGGEFREVIWGPLVCYIIIQFTKHHKKRVE